MISKGMIMRVLILYYSRTGNTEKLAEKIAEGVKAVNGAEALMRDTDSVTKEDFIECDAIIAGSPVYFGSMAWELKAVFDKFVGTRNKMGDKIGAAFATSGDPNGGKETTILSILQAMLIYGMVICGDPLDASGHYGAACQGPPEARTSDHAFKLGKRVAELALKVRG